MEIRIIEGHRATDRRGAAEHLGKSHQTIKLLASKREETGFPEPVKVETTGKGVRTLPDGTKGGREWYSLADLDTFRTTYLDQLAADNMPRSHGRQLQGDRDELLSATEFGEALDVNPGPFRRYVSDSRPAWDAYKVMNSAIVSGNRAIPTEPVEADTHGRASEFLIRYGGHWDSEQRAYIFPGEARDAVKPLLAGEAFFLPYPDDEQPGNRGTIRKWRRATVQAFIDDRPGKTASPGRPPTTR